MRNSLPVRLTEHVALYGNEHFHHYLVGENSDVLVECGVTASAVDVVDQLSTAGRPGPTRMLTTHAHFDHVCGILKLKRHFPGAEVVASPIAARVLDKPKVIDAFFEQDRRISALFKRLGPGAGAGCESVGGQIPVDRTAEGGERIPVQGTGALELIAAPGHSPCGLAAWFEKDRVLFVSDSMGFQISDREILPLFFYSFPEYMKTIERLAAYPSEVLAFAHERIWKGTEVKAVFSRALSTARGLREEILSELDRGTPEPLVKQSLFERYYHGNLHIYSPENIRVCVDLLVRRSIEAG